MEKLMKDIVRGDRYITYHDGPGTVTFVGGAAQRIVGLHMDSGKDLTFNPAALEKHILSGKFEIGNLVAGRNVRGRITEIDTTAAKWPYSVTDVHGAIFLLAAHDLVKLEEPVVDIHAQNMALVFIDAEIKEARTRLYKLERTRSVIEAAL